MVGGEDHAELEGALQPHPALKVLDRLIGTWSVKGHFTDSDEENIIGRLTFQWLDGGFFLQQNADLSFADQFQVTALELIGYDAETKAFSSFVYSDFSPEPLPYTWDLQGDALTISVSYGPLDAIFTGSFSKDGNSFSGGWRPNPGADETINTAYEFSATRAS